MATPTHAPRGARTGGAAGRGAPWFKTSQRVLGRDWPTAYLFMLPMVLLLFGLIGYPFVRALYLSFHNAVGIRIGNFVGLDNYINLWADDFFIRAVWITVDLHRRLGVLQVLARDRDGAAAAQRAALGLGARRADPAAVHHP